MIGPAHASSSGRRSRARPAQQPREPAPNARQRLLEAAGQVFAEKGFVHATGAEIGRRAGVNAAAVNYYFGSKEGLHTAAVLEAHHRLISLEALSQAVSGHRSARAKLRSVIGLVSRRLSGSTLSWELPVLARELVAPSRALAELREREILPKAALLKSMVSELMRLPPDHPSVAIGCIGAVAPFLMLAIVDRATLGTVFPSVGKSQADPDLVARSMLRYALAGLEALKREAKAARAGTPPA